jgi:Chaperone of endosialidase
MGARTAKLNELRPVTFRYKGEPDGPEQFGLIAEEVAKVYPELVIRDARGEILSVRYDELAPMLLNAMKLQDEKIKEQERRLQIQDVSLRTQAQRIEKLDEQAAEIRELKAAVQAVRAQMALNH